MTADARLSRRALLGLGLAGLRREAEADGERRAGAGGGPGAAPTPAGRAGGGAAPDPVHVALAAASLPVGEACAALLAAARIEPGHRVLDVEPPGRRGAQATAITADVATARVEEAAALPFEAQAFDRVISLFGLIHAPDQRGAVNEIDRVLRPGGVVAVTAWASTGLMGRVLRLLRPGGGGPPARPERWGRYEGVQLAFSRFPGFEFREASMRWTFADVEAACAALAPPPRAAEEVRALLGERGRDEGGDFVVDVAYVLAVGRKPDWA